MPAIPMSVDLFAAIEAHDLGRVVDLLSKGADPNATEAQHRAWRPLHTAIDELDEGGSIDVVKVLLERGADVNGWDGLHEASPIIMALVRNNMPALRLLLEAGADPNVRSREGEGPLRWAADEGNLEMAQLFLKYGAAKTIDEYGGFRALTALGMAVARMDVPMIELLLAAGADPEARDFDDMTARQHLPPRESSDPARRAEVLELLARTRVQAPA
jgi:uncharacterized protein